MNTVGILPLLLLFIIFILGIVLFKRIINHVNHLWTLNRTKGEIQVRYYMTPTVVAGLDITGQLRPPSLKLKGERLIISFLEHDEVHLTHLQNEFTIKQFSSTGYLNEWYHPGARALYIRLPQHIELEANDHLHLYRLESNGFTRVLYRRRNLSAFAPSYIDSFTLTVRPEMSF